MTEQEALGLAEQIDADMGGPTDDYGWVYLSPEDDGTWVMCFFDWPVDIASPTDWEAMNPDAESMASVNRFHRLYPSGTSTHVSMRETEDASDEEE